MKRATALERLLSRIEVNDVGCWIWQGATAGRGYGVLRIGSLSDASRRMTYTHRIAYEAMVGPIPAGLQIDHLCRETRCCNPDHLEPVSAAENLRRSTITDKVRERHAQRVACHRGHEYTPDNVKLRPDGARRCLTCERERRTP